MITPYQRKRKPIRVFIQYVYLFVNILPGRFILFTMLMIVVGCGRQRGNHFPREFFYFWPKHPTKSFLTRAQGAHRDMA